MATKKRFHVFLGEDQIALARDVAKQRGVRVGEVLRAAIDEYLAKVVISSEEVEAAPKAGRDMTQW